MGDYNFQGLNTRDFEHIVQSLTKKILGNGSITFGDGTDGGREATFLGKGYFHSPHDPWEGYWVIQAKFKQRDNNEDNYQWVKNNLDNEMEKFNRFKMEGKDQFVPHNYLFFTNVILTPVLETGMHDKIQELVRSYQSLIPNICIVGYDDLCRLLDNNRDVATAYASFIRTGDILEQVFAYFKEKNEGKKDYTDSLLRFLYREFTADLHSQLRQAGDNTGEKINLEEVFIDLFATQGPDLNMNEQRHPKFLERCIFKGNTILRPNAEKNTPNNTMLGYILIGDAGYGKSTLTQFLSQIYRAYFLYDNSNRFVWPQVAQFIDQFRKLEFIKPECSRFPLKIVLKDYAGWSIENKKKQESFSIMSYFQHRMQVVADIEMSIDDIRDLLKKISFLFIFDGLDEVPITSNRSDILKEIHHFVEYEIATHNCDALVIATTRPQGYNDDFNKINLEKVQLVPLSIEECREYIIKIVRKFSDDPDQVAQLTSVLFKALEDDTVSKLMETPLQATIMSYLVRMGGEPPRNKFDLFTNYINTMITREQQKGVIEVISDLSHHIKSIHNRLGYYLHKGSEEENNPSSNISDEQFQEFINRYLLEELGYEGDRVEVISRNIMDAIESRLAFITKTTDSTVGFCVRSLQEYFAAMYLMTHRNDSEIKKSLKIISSSAYWRKSFLFAVGYLTRQRNDMIGYLIELCQEMNGNDVGIGRENIKSIASLGSWLALDILNDGVLSTYPKYENMLSRLLEELFKISYQGSHRYFGTLSQSITQKIVIPFINKYMKESSNISKLTSISILFHVINTKEIFTEELVGVLDENWMENDEEIFIKFLIDFGFENDWFILKILDSINKHTNKFLYYNRFYQGFLSKKLIKLSENDSELKWIVFKNIFLLYLTTNRGKDVHLLKQMIQGESKQEEISEEDYYSNGFYFTERISLNIYENYKASGPSVFASNRNKEVFSYFCENIKSIYEWQNFASAFSTFIVEPNTKNLMVFFEEIYKEDEFVFVTLKKNSFRLSWLLGKIFEDIEVKDQIPDLLASLNMGKYGDVSQWKEFEKEIQGSDETAIHALPFFRMRMINDDAGHFTKMYSDIFKNVEFSSEEDKLIVQRELLRAFSNVEFNQETQNHFTEEMLEDLLLMLTNTGSLPIIVMSNVLVRLMLLISPARMIDIIVKRIQFSIELKNYWRVEDEYLINVYRKMSDILFPLKIENTLIRILPSFLIEIDKMNMADFQSNNYKYLYSMEYNDVRNETSRILLCLFDHLLNNNNPQIVDTFISHYRNDSELLSFTIDLFNNCIGSIAIIETIYGRIYDLIDKDDISNHSLLSKYESFLKEAYESVVVTNI